MSTEKILQGLNIHVWDKCHDLAELLRAALDSEAQSQLRDHLKTS